MLVTGCHELLGESHISIEFVDGWLARMTVWYPYLSQSCLLGAMNDWVNHDDSVH